MGGTLLNLWELAARGGIAARKRSSENTPQAGFETGPLPAPSSAGARRTGRRLDNAAKPVQVGPLPGNSDGCPR